MSAISVPPNPYFQAIDLVYIPLALGCCLVAGLYDRNATGPGGALADESACRVRLQPRGTSGDRVADAY